MVRRSKRQNTSEDSRTASIPQKRRRTQAKPPQSHIFTSQTGPASRQKQRNTKRRTRKAGHPTPDLVPKGGAFNFPGAGLNTEESLDRDETDVTSICAPSPLEAGTSQDMANQAQSQAGSRKTKGGQNGIRISLGRRRSAQTPTSAAPIAEESGKEAVRSDADLAAESLAQTSKDLSPSQDAVASLPPSGLDELATQAEHFEQASSRATSASYSPKISPTPQVQSPGASSQGDLVMDDQPSSEDDDDSLGEVSEDDGGIVLNMDDDLQNPYGSADENENENELRSSTHRSNDASNADMQAQSQLQSRDEDSTDDLMEYSRSDNVTNLTDPDSKKLGNGQIKNGSSNHSAPTGQVEPVSEKPDSLIVPFEGVYENYSKPPQTLADLNPHDFDEQVKYIFFHLDPRKIDLKTSITCVNCFQQGHLVAVCPKNQCTHCGAWAKHHSNFCPSTWRCTRCRQTGHSQGSCPSSLKASSSEFPCDICSSSDHIENKCPMLWEQPQRVTPGTAIDLYVNCAYCASNSHLVGDCPHKRPIVKSSLFSLKGFEASQIINLSLATATRSNTRNKGRSNGFDDQSSSYRGDLRGPPDYQSHQPAASMGSYAVRDTNHNSYRSRREENDRHAPDSWRRSRSPETRSYQGDRYQSHQQSRRTPPRQQFSSQRGRGGSYNGGVGRGGGSGRGGGARGRGGRKNNDSGNARPLPSAGKKAWGKFSN